MIYIEPAAFTFGIRYAKKRSPKYWCMSLLLRQTTDMGPKHRVTITKGFYLAQTETRVDLYCAFLNDVKDADQYIGDNLFSRVEQHGGLYAPKLGAEACPVNTVPWVGAQAFCDWLSQKTGRRFRLPTEAEWELAAYGTEKRRHAWGNKRPRAVKEELEQYYGPYDRAEPWSCGPVGSRPKNVTPDGLFDMTSVTGEWVSDWYAPEYDVQDNVDPQGPASGKWKVLRGEHVDRRRFLTPSFSHTAYLGFRLLMELDE